MFLLRIIYVNYELRVTNYELGKAYVLWICGIRNVKFNIEKYLSIRKELKLLRQQIYSGVAGFILNYRFAPSLRYGRQETQTEVCYSAKNVRNLLIIT